MLRLTGYLRARLGRRIALLFFLCALVPIGAFSLVTWRHARGQLEQQSRERLRLLGKESAQALLYRLHAASLEGARWARDSSAAGPPDGLVARGTSAPGEDADLDGVAIPAIDDEGRRHLALGRPLLRALDGRVLLGLPSGADRVVWLELERGYVSGRTTPWSEGGERSPLPAGVEVCLVAGETALTACPAALLEALREEAPADPIDPRQLTWHAPDGERFGARRPVFLRTAFGAPNWELVLSEPRATALSAVGDFQRTLLLVTLLSLLVVPFASQVQIRRNLEPLARLEEGTRRLAGREFDSRVEIRSGDEFEELADAFNTMADRLGRQFGVLRTSNEIDRAILSELRADAILETVVARAPEVLTGARVLLLARRLDGAVDVVGSGEPSGLGREGPPWSPAELLDLASRHEGPPLHLGGEELDPHVWTLFPVRVDRSVGAALLLGTRGDPSAEDVEHAAQMADRVAVALANARLVDELDRLNMETITAFARAIDAKSAWTAGHSERVTDMTLSIADALGVPPEEREVLRRGALLHDIGKIGVPGAVLDKPGKLTEEEFALMRAHTTMGASILEPISGLREIIPIARHHHERFDGRGYPDGLAGRAIPFRARIVSVADVFDALSSARPYRDAMPLERVVEIIVGDAGSAFDPEVVDAFIHVVPMIEKRSEVVA